MTNERTVLLVVHTGREEATETARRVEKVLSDNNIGLRVLSAEAVDRGPSQLAPDDMRALGVEIEVVDADGKIIPWINRGGGSNGERSTILMGVHPSAVMGLKPPQPTGPPARLRLYKLITVRRDLPFEFRDLPMP